MECTEAWHLKFEPLKSVAMPHYNLEHHRILFVSILPSDIMSLCAILAPAISAVCVCIVISL